jgi:hypothetical protein
MSSKDSKSIISALCWVRKGHANPVLKEYEPTEEEYNQHLKASKKLLKGQDISKKELKEAAKEIQQNMEDMDIEDD